ncbi:ABC transporter B family member 17 [Vitis vinifera]|uniref:ABC transporter B family member 17 n=1 Tax=Vitis vinifera TaxID=29760 RepID=A0A438CLJ4_VITVI|nr:ABC transporter B family member 17 [Vitis vinifera]
MTVMPLKWVLGVTIMFKDFSLRIPIEKKVALVKGSGSGKSTVVALLQRFYDPLGGEKGVQMSRIQKQRITIARAVIKAPQMLLLNEGTNALDSKSKRVVQETLNNTIVGRTTIIIAHRLSTIRNAYIIVAVQDTQVMEMSSHNQLMQNPNGLYTFPICLQQTDQPSKVATSLTPTISLHLHNNNNDSTSLTPLYPA